MYLNIYTYIYIHIYMHIFMYIHIHTTLAGSKLKPLCLPPVIESNPGRLEWVLNISVAMVCISFSTAQDCICSKLLKVNAFVATDKYSIFFILFVKTLCVPCIGSNAIFFPLPPSAPRYVY
jgi:hypothetical protein